LSWLYSNQLIILSGTAIQNNCSLWIYSVKTMYMWWVFKKKYSVHIFLWCKAEFTKSLLQSSVSHDPYDLQLKKHLELVVKINNMETSRNVFHDSSKEQHLFERGVFCNIVMSHFNKLMRPCW